MDLQRAREEKAFIRNCTDDELATLLEIWCEPDEKEKMLALRREAATRLRVKADNEESD